MDEAPVDKSALWGEWTDTAADKKEKPKVEKKTDHEPKVSFKPEIKDPEPAAEPMETSSSVVPGTDLKEDMMLHLIRLPSTEFKLQERGEEDLTDKKKRELAEALLQRSRSLFLAKFGKHLEDRHLDLFDKECDEDDDDLVGCHLEQLRSERGGVGLRRKRNRRLRALRKMEADSGDDDYFGVDAMRERQPKLFHEMVGRHCKQVKGEEEVSSDNTRFRSVAFIYFLF